VSTLRESVLKTLGCTASPSGLKNDNTPSPLRLVLQATRRLPPPLQDGPKAPATTVADGPRPIRPMEWRTRISFRARCCKPQPHRTVTRTVNPNPRHSTANGTLYRLYCPSSRPCSECGGAPVFVAGADNSYEGSDYYVLLCITMYYYVR